MFGLDDVINTGLKIIDKVIPDPKAKAEAQQKLLELKQNGELKIEEFAVKREEIAATDRDSARKREMEVKDKVPATLAFIVVICTFSTLGFVLTGKVALTGEQGLVVGTIIGAVTTFVTQVLNYYFGSTSSSSQKNATINNLINK